MGENLRILTNYSYGSSCPLRAAKRSERLRVQKVAKHFPQRKILSWPLRNSDELKFSMKSLTFFRASCLYFAKKLPRKTKNCSRLLEPQKVAPNAKSCQAQSEQAYLYLHYRDVCTWNTSDFVTNSCGESWDSSFFFCPSLEPMSPSSKGNGSSLENQMKMLGLLCNQTVNLKTDSKTLYDSILKSKYSSSILKHNKG